MQAALAYCLNLTGVSGVIANVASSAELRAVIAASHAPMPDIDWQALALEEGPASISTRLGLGAVSAA